MENIPYEKIRATLFAHKKHYLLQAYVLYL